MNLLFDSSQNNKIFQHTTGNNIKNSSIDYQLFMEEIYNDNIYDLGIDLKNIVNNDENIYETVKKSLNKNIIGKLNDSKDSIENIDFMNLFIYLPTSTDKYVEFPRLLINKNNMLEKNMDLKKFDDKLLSYLPDLSRNSYFMLIGGFGGGSLVSGTVIKFSLKYILFHLREYIKIKKSNKEIKKLISRIGNMLELYKFILFRNSWELKELKKLFGINYFYIINSIMDKFDYFYSKSDKKFYYKNNITVEQLDDEKFYY